MARGDCSDEICSICAEIYQYPYRFCCLNECGEHEFCRGCDKGIYLKNEKGTLT